MTFFKLEDISNLAQILTEHVMIVSLIVIHHLFIAQVPLLPTIWLTAVLDKSLGFLQIIKDPRAYIPLSHFAKIWAQLLKNTLC